MARSKPLYKQNMERVAADNDKALNILKEHYKLLKQRTGNRASLFFIDDCRKMTMRGLTGGKLAEFMENEGKGTSLMGVLHSLDMLDNLTKRER